MHEKSYLNEEQLETLQVLQNLEKENFTRYQKSTPGPTI